MMTREYALFDDHEVSGRGHEGRSSTRQYQTRVSLAFLSLSFFFKERMPKS